YPWNLSGGLHRARLAEFAGRRLEKAVPPCRRRDGAPARGRTVLSARGLPDGHRRRQSVACLLAGLCRHRTCRRPRGGTGLAGCGKALPCRNAGISYIGDWSREGPAASFETAIDSLFLAESALTA